MVTQASSSGGQCAILFGTYNILNPYSAVKWNERAGLNLEGRQTDPSVMRASTQAADDTAWRKYSNWSHRCPLVAQNMEKLDIICVQETSEETISDLLKDLSKKGYQLACAVFHKSSSDKEKFGNALFFNTKTVSVIKSFESQYQPPAPNQQWTRSAACAVFQAYGKIFKVASVHLSGYTPTEPDLQKKQASKIKGYDELGAYVSQLESEATPADCIVIGGDFNEDPGEQVHDLYRLGYLQKQGYASDGNLQVTEPLNNRRVDWLRFKGPFQTKTCMQLQPLSLETQQTPASDHLLTGTAVTWNA